MVSKYTDSALCNNVVLASGNQVLFMNMQLTLQGKSAEKGAKKTGEKASKSAGKGAKKTPEKGSKTVSAAPLHEVSPESLLSDLFLIWGCCFFGIIKSVKAKAN